MLTCIFCAKPKGLMNEITNQIKGLSLKTGGTRRRKKKQQGEGDDANDEAKAKSDQEEEWIAEVEPGVFITLVALANGANRLKKIRFREEMYDVLGAQRWWGENYQKVMELYSIQQEHTPMTPLQSDDEYPVDSVEAQKSDSSSATASNSGDGQIREGSRTVDENENENENKNENDSESEWVVEDEPGVFVTIRSLPDGTRQLLRIELSRERFGEVKARVWWQENKDRLYKQYS